MQSLDRLFEKSARSLAKRTSRRSLLASLGQLLTGAALLPLLPIDRTARAQSPAPEQSPAAGAKPTADEQNCDYWKYCAIDGFLCACCGGTSTSCPPGTQSSPITWIGTCHNPGDGRDYIVSYNDCASCFDGGFAGTLRTRTVVIRPRCLIESRSPSRTSCALFARKPFTCKAPAFRCGKRARLIHSRRVCRGGQRGLSCAPYLAGQYGHLRELITTMIVAMADQQVRSAVSVYVLHGQCDGLGSMRENGAPIAERPISNSPQELHQSIGCGGCGLVQLCYLQVAISVAQQNIHPAGTGWHRGTSLAKCLSAAC